jgi:hypothetical protein
MSDDRLDLRALGDVDSPEVLSGALRAFRRRVLTRYLWAAAAVLAVALVGFWWSRPDSLSDRIAAAGGVRVWRTADAGGVRLGVSRVADLGETVGIELVVLPPPGSPKTGPIRNPSVKVQGSVLDQQWEPFLRWFEVPAAPPGADDLRVSVVIRGAGCTGAQACAVTLDLAELGVPASTFGGE